MTVRAVGPKLIGFRALTQTLLKTSGLEEAADLVSQSIRIIESGADSLYGESQRLGTTIYEDHMKGDSALWSDSGREWGRGPGYRDRVYNRYRDWFADNQVRIDAQINTIIEDMWQEVLDRISAILQTD